MDSTTDNSLRTLWGIVKAAGTPDYIARGSLVDGKDAESLPDTSFADRVNRRFPITDRANTWASAGYFAKTAADMGYTESQKENVLAMIKRAASVYGIANDVNDVMEKVSAASKPAEKRASDETAFCDPDHRGYPVFDKQGAEMANEFFSKNAYRYGHDRRMSIAKNIMKKSAEFGVKVAEQVRLSAGDGFPNREVLAEHLLFRANELLRRGTYKMASELCKFAKEICICSDEDLFRNRNGLFDAIGGMDEVTGIDELYDKKFAAPEELVFDIPLSAMREVSEDAVPMGGDTFSAKALSELPRALFEKVLPKEMVDGMMEGGKISPKKLSVTIIGLKSPESSHLKRTIKDFSDGLIDVDEDGPNDVSGELDDGQKLELKNDGDGKVEVEVDDEGKGGKETDEGKED